LNFADDFRAGAAAFDRGEHFAAHEHWEAVWLALSGTRRDPTRRWVQAWIQVAAAFVKQARGNLRGRDKLLAAARGPLDEEPPPAFADGLDVGHATDAALQLCERAAQHPRCSLSPASVQFGAAEVDAQKNGSAAAP